MIPPLKQITGWPGYFVSQDGQVYSTRDSAARNYKPVKVNSYGKVAMHRPGQYKHSKPAELAAEAWRPRWYDKQGGADRGTVRDKSEADGQRTNDAKGKVEGPSSTKVSGL